jgi:hypothetical protein
VRACRAECRQICAPRCEWFVACTEAAALELGPNRRAQCIPSTRPVSSSARIEHFSRKHVVARSVVMVWSEPAAIRGDAAFAGRPTRGRVETWVEKLGGTCREHAEGSACVRPVMWMNC